MRFSSLIDPTSVAAWGAALSAVASASAAFAAWRTARFTGSLADLTKGMLDIYTRSLEVSEAALESNRRAIELSVETGVENQRSAAILNFSARYDELYRFRWEAGLASVKSARNPKDRDSREVYFRRYWGLQADQFNHWLMGYVDPDTLINWLLSVTHHLTSEEKVGGLPFSEGWGLVRDQHKVTNHHLYTFVQETLERGARERHTPVQIHALIILFLRDVEAIEADYIARMSANHPNRVTINEYVKTIRDELKIALDTAVRTRAR